MNFTARSTFQSLEDKIGHSWRFSRKLFLTVVMLLVILASARIALPYVLREATNHRLARIPDYHGQAKS